MNQALRDEVRRSRTLPGPQACRAIRLAAGLSQERLARELGVHRVTVTRWEAGRLPRGQARLAYGDLLRELQAVVVE